MAPKETGKLLGGLSYSHSTSSDSVSGSSHRPDSATEANFIELCWCGGDIFAACPTCAAPLCQGCMAGNQCSHGGVSQVGKWTDLSFWAPELFGEHCRECDLIATHRCRHCEVRFCINHAREHDCQGDPPPHRLVKQARKMTSARKNQRKEERDADQQTAQIRHLEVDVEKNAVEINHTEAKTQKVLAETHNLANEDRALIQQTTARAAAETRKLHISNDIEDAKRGNEDRSNNIKTLELECEFERKTMYSLEGLTDHLRRAAFGKYRTPKTFIPQMKAAAETFFNMTLVNDPTIKHNDFIVALTEVIEPSETEISLIGKWIESDRIIRLHNALEGKSIWKIPDKYWPVPFVEPPTIRTTEVAEPTENSQVWRKSAVYRPWVKMTTGALVATLLITQGYGEQTTRIISSLMTPKNVLGSIDIHQ